MEISAFWFFAVLEALVLALAYGAYLHWRLGRAKDGWHADAGVSADACPAPLQEQLRQTEAALSALGEPGVDEAGSRRRHLLETRLAFLRAERKAAEAAAAGENGFWDELEQGLAPFLAAGEKDSLLVQSLRTQLLACEKRLSNLERFKELFFELKGQLADSRTLGEQLQMEVAKAVPASEQSPELKNLLDGLRSENERLSQQLEYVDEAFSDILRRAHEQVDVDEAGVAASISGIDQGVERIRGVIQAQQRRISGLATLISEKDMELEQKRGLESLLGEVREANEELTSIITVLEEENEFLQVQISMLLKQELEKEAERERTLEETRQARAEQEAAYAELSKRFAAMEKEYLLVFEENRRLKGD